MERPFPVALSGVDRFFVSFPPQDPWPLALCLVAGSLVLGASTRSTTHSEFYKSTHHILFAEI